MKKVILPCILLILLFAGCAGSKLSEEDIGKPTIAAPQNVIDRQEKAFKDVLAESDATTLRREGDSLIVTMKGDVTFDSNSASVKPRLYGEINRIAGVLVQYPQTSVRVEGHTDSVGKESYNLQLSKKRAEAVKDLLVKFGVSDLRILILPFGATVPAASNDTEAGRQKNRRVELKIVPQN